MQRNGKDGNKVARCYGLAVRWNNIEDEQNHLFVLLILNLL